MKSFSERNPIVIGAVGAVTIAAIALAALNYDKLPLLHRQQATRPTSPKPAA